MWCVFPVSHVSTELCVCLVCIHTSVHEHTSQQCLLCERAAFLSWPATTEGQYPDTGKPGGNGYVFPFLSLEAWHCLEPGLSCIPLAALCLSQSPLIFSVLTRP